MTDLLTTYRRATGKEARLRIEADQAARERAKALAGMHVAGLSYARIAADTGLSRSRVQQLVERGLDLGNRQIEALAREIKRHDLS